MKRTATGEFLLEIGCEEIPARLLDSARNQLQELLEAEFSTRGILAGEMVRSFATPRRLVATCAALALKEPDRESQVIGPPKAVAFDAQGRPTRAGESFAQKQGVKVGQLKVVETPRGAYVAAVTRRLGEPTSKILSTVIPSALQSLNFPRSMYWTSPQGLRFIRPVRWLLALLAGKVVPVELNG
ncbi:MAG: glycine--tRNA ligase subunit beta, partial [Candidatus Acidiferrales bacterium]